MDLGGGAPLLILIYYDSFGWIYRYWRKTFILLYPESFTKSWDSLSYKTLFVFFHSEESKKN